MTDYTQLVEKYREQAAIANSPLEFYREVRADKVSKFAAFVLLRELFDLGLVQCFEIDSRVNTQPDGP
jgi:hypothetical protein